ncbi:MAG: hypothetical protein V4736_03360 [Bdellovibrionota bacterium]
MSSTLKNATSPPKLRKDAGQAALEYVLLMVISATLALLVVKHLASRKPGEEGAVIQKWNNILVTIGKDLPDK